MELQSSQKLTIMQPTIYLMVFSFIKYAASFFFQLLISIASCLHRNINEFVSYRFNLFLYMFTNCWLANRWWSIHLLHKINDLLKTTLSKCCFKILTTNYTHIYLKFLKIDSVISTNIWCCWWFGETHTLTHTIICTHTHTHIDCLSFTTENYEST